MCKLILLETSPAVVQVILLSKLVIFGVISIVKASKSSFVDVNIALSVCSVTLRYVCGYTVVIATLVAKSELYVLPLFISV